MNACSILAIEAQGSEIATVESLDKNGDLHPVQDAFIECDGPVNALFHSGDAECFLDAMVSLRRQIDHCPLKIACPQATGFARGDAT